MTAVPAVVAGALLGSLFTVGVFHLNGPQSPSVSQANMRGMERAFYPNTVMQNGYCNISKEDDKPVPNPLPEFPHVIATVVNPNYGLHILVLGRDSKIYHKHQVGHANWTSWKCLTPDFTKVPCSMSPHCDGFDNNPVAAWQPENGTIVAFVRQMDDLVPYEFHLTDPKDPDSWSSMRTTGCLCNFPPCAGQTSCGVVAQCDNLGKDCNKHPETGREYYAYGPIFPTSELVLQPDPKDPKKLTLYWRGFDGQYYSATQDTAGDAGGKYGLAGFTAYTGGDSTIE